MIPRGGEHPSKLSLDCPVSVCPVCLFSCPPCVVGVCCVCFAACVFNVLLCACFYAFCYVIFIQFIDVFVVCVFSFIFSASRCYFNIFYVYVCLCLRTFL